MWNLPRVANVPGCLVGDMCGQRRMYLPAPAEPPLHCAHDKTRWERRPEGVRC